MSTTIPPQPLKNFNQNQRNQHAYNTLLYDIVVTLGLGLCSAHAGCSLSEEF